MAEERIGGKTKDQWEQDLLRLRKIAAYHYTVAKRANKKNRPDIEAEALADHEALCSIYVLAEYVIERYEWKGTPKKAVQ